VREKKLEEHLVQFLDDLRACVRLSHISVDVRRLICAVEPMYAENTPFVAYYRVSTRRQQASGLGLEAQQRTVRDLVTGMRGRIVAEFTETESGKVDDRPQLAAAIATTRRQGGVLVVAKLDRLARSVRFTSALMDSNVDFVCCDQPVANRLTLHILSAVAENERAMIATRTREALQAAKERGTKLGSHRVGHWTGREQQRLDGLERAREKSRKVIRRRGIERYEDIVPVLRELRQKGLGGESIARELEARGIPARTGKKWSGTMIRRLLIRFGIQKEER